MEAHRGEVWVMVAGKQVDHSQDHIHTLVYHTLADTHHCSGSQDGMTWDMLEVGEEEVEVVDKVGYHTPRCIHYI